MALISTGKSLVDEPTHHDLGHLTHEPELMAKIMRKRHAEVERRAKLFDPRTRQHGANHADLDAQLSEKRAAADAALAEEQFHAANGLMTDQVSQVFEHLKRQGARDRQAAAVSYSLEHLTKDKRREWALSDPDALRSELPMRAGDDDPRCGPASMLAFDGEDQKAQQKKREAQQLQRLWLEQQVADNQAKARRAAEEHQADDLAALTANEVRSLCEQQTLQDLRDEKCAEADENLRMARAHRLRKQAASQRDTDAARKHVDHIKHHERSTEVHDLKRGLDGRVVRQDYKRLPIDEEYDVYHTNKMLVLEKQAKHHAEHQREVDHAGDTLKATGVLNAIEEERARQAKERHKNMVQENFRLAEQKRLADLEDRRKLLAFEHEP